MQQYKTSAMEICTTEYKGLRKRNKQSLIEDKPSYMKIPIRNPLRTTGITNSPKGAPKMRFIFNEVMWLHLFYSFTTSY